MVKFKKIINILMASVVTLSLASCSDITVSKEAFDLEEIGKEDTKNINLKEITYYLASEEDIKELYKKNNLELKTDEVEEIENTMEEETVEVIEPKKNERPDIDYKSNKVEDEKPKGNKEITVTTKPNKNPKPNKPNNNHNGNNSNNTNNNSNTNNSNNDSNKPNDNSKPVENTNSDNKESEVQSSNIGQ